jgi:curved DNA-binding protein CbpA
MDTSKFIDYYEILEISPNANSGTIDRVFRHLAQRYHPDNPDAGDRQRFDVVMEAHNTLGDPGKRARYDVEHKLQAELRWKLIKQASNGKGSERDVEMQNKLLSILYVRRRQNIRDPGLGNLALEGLLGCPTEHLDFHLWYLKEKGWIGVTESGMYAITAEGVDRANSDHVLAVGKKLLTDQSRTS